MKQKTTFPLWKRLLFLFLLVLPLSHSWGQARVDAQLGEYDKSVAGGVLGLGRTPVVVNPTNVNQVDNNYARLKASPGLAATLGAFTSYIELEFSKLLSANQTSYVRLQPDGKLLEGLLGGSLGGALTDVLGVVLTGNQEFSISVANGSTNILTGSSISEFNTTSGTIKVVKDKDNYYYLAITPNTAYDRIRLVNAAKGVVGLNSIKNLDVYHAFTYENTKSTCGKPLVTSFDGGGLNLTVLSKNDPKLNLAIDDDLTSFSTLNTSSLLSLNVGGEMSQIFYFPTLSDEKASVNIKLAIPSTGVLNLSLLGGLEVLAYDDLSTTPVYQKSLSGGLLSDLNVLSLIQKGDPASIVVAPQKPFNRLEVRFKAPVGVNLLGSSIRIYDVERFDGVNCLNPLITIPNATETPFEVTSCAVALGVYDNVDFPLNAIDDNNETYATLTANNGSLLVAAPQNGRIELKYPNELAANKTSYIRIDSDKDVLDALLGGTLGKLVSDIGGLVLGNHVFTIEAYNAAGTSVLKSTSSDGFDGTTTTGSGKVSLVQDNIGRYYLAVSPTQAYQSVVISNAVSSLLPTGESATLKVYNMCTEIGTDLCRPAQFTSYDSSGLSLSAGTLNEVGVVNPYYAIDANSSNYSEISNGLLAVVGTVKQTIYFNQSSQVGDELKVRLQLDPKSLVDVNLLGGYKVVTYLGNTKKETFTLQQGLINGLDLLALFKSGGIQTLSFPTNELFDRVNIEVASVLNLSVTPALRLYDVKRVSSTCPELSSESPFIQPVCATKLLGASNADDLDNLFDDNFDSYATLNSGAGLLLGLGDQHTGYVELGYPATVPAYTTSYVRIDFDEELLNDLLGGSLGNLVSGLVNGLVLGNHYFEVEVKDAIGNPVLKAGSNTTNNAVIADGTVRVIKDKLGRTYLAITPTKAYQSVKITDKTASVLGLLAKPNTMHVYGMCYETSTEACVAAFATSSDFSGIALSVDQLADAGVKNSERAIDDNTTNFSEISFGNLSLAGAVKQYIYFTTLSDEEVAIKFDMKVGQLNVDLIGNIEIKAYNGENVVDQLVANGGFINGVNVLDLLTNGKLVELPFKPSTSYDRISVGLNSLVAVSLGANLHLYDVSRNCKPAVEEAEFVSWKSYKVNGDASIETVSGGEEVEYTIHVRNEGTKSVSNFEVKDKMPDGLTLQPNQTGTVNPVGDEITFVYSGILAPQAVATFTFSVDVNKDLKDIKLIRNIAFVGEEGDTTPSQSYPPMDNIVPTAPDTTKAPGTVLQVDGSCVLLPAVITSNGGNDICKGASIVLDAGVDADTYQWFYNGVAINDSKNPSNLIGKEKTFLTNAAGEYTVIYTINGCVSVESAGLVVKIKNSPVINVDGDLEFLVKIGDPIVYPEVTSLDGIINWFDSKGNSIADLPTSFTTAGVYSFTAIVEKDGCTTSETIIVTVYDSTQCPPTTQRVYAQGTGNWETTWYTTLAGGVSNEKNATDGNPTTHSTITLGLSLFGLGTTWQNIYFDGNAIPAGTPVSVKLGNEYSLLALGDGITVVGLNEKGEAIGLVKSVGGGLLKLLSADNVYEYTFVPSDKSGPKAYYGVRVIYGAAVGLGASMKIYGAYYNTSGSSCTPNNYVPADSVEIPEGVHPQILDIHHGIQDIGLGVATSLSPFVNPWKAVDNDPDSYAYINRTVAVINAATLTVLFKQQSMSGDELHIDIEDSANPVLSLDLLKGFRIQRYLGDQKVGPELEAGGSVLDLKLLGLGKGARRRLIVTPSEIPFDRVKIIYGNILGVLGSSVKIFDVSLNPQILEGSVDLDKYYDVCFGGLFTIENNDGCTEFKVFTNNDETGEISGIDGKDFILSNYLPLGQHSIYIQAYRNGCKTGHLQEVKINLQSCGVNSNLNVTQRIK